MFGSRPLTSERSGLTLLVLSYIVICCLSSIYVTQLYHAYRMGYEPARLFNAGVAVAAFAPVSLLFIFARFSFGYLVGFYFFSMFIGYLWLSFFSDYTYDYRTASLSAMASAVVFLLPALFMTSPVRQFGPMSLRTFDRLLTLIFLLCLVTVAIGASYNFRIANPGDVSNLRADSFPTILNYLIGITSNFAAAVLVRLFSGAQASLASGRSPDPVAVLLSGCLEQDRLFRACLACRDGVAFKDFRSQDRGHPVAVDTRLDRRGPDVPVPRTLVAFSTLPYRISAPSIFG